jgi:hypothetical protein
MYLSKQFLSLWYNVVQFTFTREQMLVQVQLETYLLLLTCFAVSFCVRAVAYPYWRVKHQNKTKTKQLMLLNQPPTPPLSLSPTVRRVISDFHLLLLNPICYVCNMSDILLNKILFKQRFGNCLYVTHANCVWGCTVVCERVCIWMNARRCYERPQTDTTSIGFASFPKGWRLVPYGGWLRLDT